jgi:aminoglycoside 6'-N-acetyltransferase
VDVALRPIDRADLPALIAVVREPSVACWWGPPTDDDALGEELLSDGSAFVVVVDGERAGWLGYHEETEPTAMHLALDIVLGEHFQDRGVGRRALGLALEHFAARGHHRATIDPAVANARAIRVYEAVGFEPVGVMRAYEMGRDGTWHDNLLMDLLL